MNLDEQIAAVVRAELRAALAELQPAARSALLDGHGLAAELRVSERQVRRLRAEGMPCVRLVESYRYELATVLAWLRERGGRP